MRYYHADAQGTVLSLVDETGAIRTRYRYTVYGAPTVVGEASGNPYMYTGREYDFETGLYFFRNRYQSPILGRFTSEDPLGVQAGLNFYAYVGNNPVNFTDPWGLDPLVNDLNQPGNFNPSTTPGEVNPVLRCHVNPHRDQYENVQQAAILLSIGTFMAQEFLFAKGSGLFNSNQYLRIGFGKGPRGVQKVFRVSGEWVEKLGKNKWLGKYINKGHIDLWP